MLSLVSSLCSYRKQTLSQLKQNRSTKNVCIKHWDTVIKEGDNGKNQINVLKPIWYISMHTNTREKLNTCF